MTTTIRRSLMLLLVWSMFSWTLPARVHAAGVQVLFSLNTPSGGPFPSNLFTVPDFSQNTRLRVNLPFPDCTLRPFDCFDLEVINTLDGFNVQPRLSVPFSGPIDVITVTSENIFLLSLGGTLPGEDTGGQVIGINQVVWDSDTHTLHVESDELLSQHSRYALVVTNEVRDTAGHRIGGKSFRHFRKQLKQRPDLQRYNQTVKDALKWVKSLGPKKSHVVAVSVFTTQSVTAVLEKIRHRIKKPRPSRRISC